MYVHPDRRGTLSIDYYITLEISCGFLPNSMAALTRPPALFPLAAYTTYRLNSSLNARLSTFSWLRNHSYVFIISIFLVSAFLVLILFSLCTRRIATADVMFPGTSFPTKAILSHKCVSWCRRSVVSKIPDLSSRLFLKVIASVVKPPYVDRTRI